VLQLIDFFATEAQHGVTLEKGIGAIRPVSRRADNRAAGRSFARNKDRGSSGAHAESARSEGEGDFRGTFRYRTYRGGAGKTWLVADQYPDWLLAKQGTVGKEVDLEF
jgi:hypothetical protein